MNKDWCIENDFAAQNEIAEMERHNSLMIWEENKSLRARVVKLEEALRFYAADDAQSVECGILGSVYERPATKTLEES